MKIQQPLRLFDTFCEKEIFAYLKAILPNVELIVRNLLLTKALSYATIIM